MSLRRSSTPFLGLLMLQTRFPRLPGDVGHSATFAFPVRRVVVAGASPQRVVREQADGLLQPFVDAARQLVDDGAAAISTSCGFLVRFQRELQAALPVPVWTSSLLVLPTLRGAAGVITVDAQALDAGHLRAAGADPTTPIEGLTPGGALQRTLLEDLPTLDEAAARDDVVAAARRLVARQPQVEHIVLECTNLPPYADAVRQATGRTVHDITTLLAQRWQELRHP